jgi:WD40 repeat protein
MGHLDAITAIAFNPAGTLVATGAAWRDKTARLWDAGSGQPIGNPMQHSADVFALAFDPKGELLATGSGDNIARLWNAHTGEPVGYPMQHAGPVWAVAFDKRSRFLATGSADSTARLWRAHTGEPIGEPMRHRGPVWAIAFDPKGKLLATGSLDEDNAARLWLALSAETLFERGRSILGPEGASGIVSTSLDFLSWVKKKITGAVEYARSFVNTAGPLERVLPLPQDAAPGSVVVAK